MFLILVLRWNHRFFRKYLMKVYIFFASRKQFIYSTKHFNLTENSLIILELLHELVSKIANYISEYSFKTFEGNISVLLVRFYL